MTTAALFGWISSRLLKLPITVGASLLMANLARLTPGVENWAARFAGRIDFETLILHGLLPLLLFAGAHDFRRAADRDRFWTGENSLHPRTC